MSEKRFRAAITSVLRSGGAMVSNVEDRAGVGFPDVTAIYQGEVKFFELKYNKAPDGKTPRLDVRASQIRWLREAWSKGASAWLLIKMQDGDVRCIRGCDANLVTAVKLVWLGRVIDARTCRTLWEECER